MEHEIFGNPDRGNITFFLAAGEKVVVEAGSMSFMTAGAEARPRLVGGFVRSAARLLFGGESLFLTEYSTATAGCLAVAPAFPGTVVHRELAGGDDAILMAAGAFLAGGPEVQITTALGGMRGLLSGAGVVVLRAAGRGPLFFNTYGAVLERRVEGELVVDTGHLVAWEPALEWTIGGMGSWKSTLLSGEGLVCRFRGSGTVWLQSRPLSGFVRWLAPFCH